VLNVSNHPHALWPPEQCAAARKFGNVIDCGFPQVEPGWGPAEMAEAARRFVALIRGLEGEKIAFVDGSSAMASLLVRELQARGVRCLWARSPERRRKGPFVFHSWCDWPKLTVAR
jgi:hypothetical protein